MSLPPCFVSCFLILFVDTNYFGLRYHTRTQPFLTLFPFGLFFLSFYSLLGFLLPFFNYTLLSMSFSLFFFFPFFYSIPFSHMSILGTRTTRAFNPSFLILQTGKIPAGYGSVLFNFFFRLYLITGSSICALFLSPRLVRLRLGLVRGIGLYI